MTDGIDAVSTPDYRDEIEAELDVNVKKKIEAMVASHRSAGPSFRASLRDKPLELLIRQLVRIFTDPNE